MINKKRILLGGIMVFISIFLGVGILFQFHLDSRLIMLIHLICSITLIIGLVLIFYEFHKIEHNKFMDKLKNK